MAIKHTIRINEKGDTQEESLTPRTAILRFCYECCGYNYYEVGKCTSLLCPLYPFRNRTVTKGTRIVRQKTLDTLAKAREQRQESKKKG